MPNMKKFSSPASSAISTLAPSIVPIVRAPFSMNFMFPVPDASVPAVEICSDRSAAGITEENKEQFVISSEAYFISNRLAKEQSNLFTISRFRSSSGDLLTDPILINERSAAYYQSLYSSRVTNVDADLTAYLEEVSLSHLTYTDKLDIPITIEELQKALMSLQSGKTFP